MATTVGLGWQQLVLETCCNCGVVFGMSPAIYEQRRKDHASFWCPNGHSQHYTGQTPDQQRIAELTARVVSAEEAQKWAEFSARGARIARGKAEAKMRRTLERVHAGVCPHCHRTFQQLAAHMASKHQEEIAK